MDWKDRIAIVTGASSGIGAAIARRLAQAGLRVVLVARRIGRLRGVQREIRAQGGQAEAIAADLAAEAGRQQVYEYVNTGFGEVDVLVNNAGLGWYGYFAEMNWETARQIVEVNAAAAAHLSNLFLPGMLQRNRGHIINIGSIAGGFPNQGVAIYSATKAFLDAFTTALCRETAGTRVRVSVVRAGPVQSEFCAAAARRTGGRHLPTERSGIPAETVAERVWWLLRHPRRVLYVPAGLAITPLIELAFGWLIDRLGPLLLKHRST